MGSEVEIERRKLMKSFPEMEWNARWDWDNLGMFNSKASESLKKIPLTDWEMEDEAEIDAGSFNFSGSGSGGSGSDLAHASSVKSSVSASADSSPKDGIRGLTFEAFEGSSGAIVRGTEPVRAELSGTSSPLEASVVSVEPLIDLKLGTYFEKNCAGNNSKRLSSVVPLSSTVALKKSKSSSQGATIQRCQVEGCNLDLSSAKEYHRKHRVCDSHSKCPKVVVGGLERRFCQQCSRFHSLSEFDEKKRSCRRRLSDHNARRRKPRQETIQFHSSNLSSSFYDGRQELSFSLNNVKSAGNSWENICSSKFTLTKRIPLKSDKGGQSSMPLTALPYAINMDYNSSDGISASKRTTAEVFVEGFNDTMFSSNLDAAPEFPRALSLLSTTSWGSSELESIPLDHPFHANSTGASLPMMHSISQGLPLPSSEYGQIERQSVSPHLHNLGGSSNSGGHFQEIQLLKPQYGGDIFSNTLN